MLGCRAILALREYAVYWHQISHHTQTCISPSGGQDSNREQGARTESDSGDLV